jgi:probable F420-dependent oxidoreductase
MRLGLFVPSVSPFATPEYLAVFARAAEDGGFASVWMGEHAVGFDDYESRYPYSADGRIGLAPESGMLDLFSTLGFLAAASEQLRLGTAVCLLPQRNPVLTAKEASTVDWLSGGRLDLGIGIGWLREEFETLGARFEERAPRCREYVEIMQRLWRDDVSSYEGRFYQVPPCRMFPKPVQQPHPPIYFGGESDAALRRVADLGNGWHGFAHLPDSAAKSVARLETLLGERGRTLADVDVTVCPYLEPVRPDHLPAYRDAGVDQLVLLPFAADADGIREAIGRLSDDFAPRAARL